MKTIIAIHNESVYNEILRQAVAVIEMARLINQSIPFK